jgi:lactoylglutathione lyase
MPLKLSQSAPWVGVAFVRSPDNVSVELLQKGAAKALAEPWVSMGNTAHW